MKFAIFVCALFIFSCGSVTAFQLSPEGSQIERDLSNYQQGQLGRIISNWTLRGLQTFGDPVHEEITNRILGCDGEVDVCGKPNRYPRKAYILSGVRWNDDPPFMFESGYGNFRGCSAGHTIRFVTYPECWLNVFKYGKNLSTEGKPITNKYPLMLRSHFGDLQFLHAMASKEGEDPAQTRDHILTWAEFTWRLHLKEFKPSTLLKEVPVAGMKEMFGTKGWDINDLFRLGNDEINGADNIAEVAYGSLLHIIEDSFALGHVDRAFADGNENCNDINILAPGKIREFHAYNLQNTDSHASDDARVAFARHWAAPRPHVVDVGRSLHVLYQNNASWDEVKPYLECIFAIHPDSKSSSSGDKYRR